MSDFNNDDTVSINTKPALLGCVADDVTGATDVAINLVQGGMRVVQFLSVPTVAQLNKCDCDAIVVALKTRSIPAEQAVEQSLEAIEVLRQYGCQRFLFKYCSTFDSTERGNIGPVADAMLQFLQTNQTIVCPAFPRNQRTVYRGHLFVGDQLLNESGMQDHPLNPMKDANLCRWLAPQTKNEIGLIDYDVVTAGPAAIQDRLKQLRGQDKALVVVDCCSDQHLASLAAAVSQLSLVTGGSGIGRFLPDAWRADGRLSSKKFEPQLPQVFGRSLIIAGSCSLATQRQVANMRGACESFRLNVSQLVEDAGAEKLRFEQWLGQRNGDESNAMLVYSSSERVEVQALQDRYGVEHVSQAIEDFHAVAAEKAVAEHRVRRLIVAGGETAGAVVKRLQVTRLEIGPEICAGVPWTKTDGPTPLALVLKSGNFGDDDFFGTALEMLP